MKLGTLPFRLCLYLGLHPEAKLTSTEIAEMFHIEHPSGVAVALSNAKKADYIVNVTKHCCNGHRAVYVAGPRLLRMAGRA